MNLVITCFNQSSTYSNGLELTIQTNRREITMNETAQELRDQAAVLIARSVALDRSQLSRADLDDMSSDQIETARMTGRLDAILGISPTQIALFERARTGFIDVADVDLLSDLHQEDLIEAARVGGRINMANTPKENQ